LRSLTEGVVFSLSLRFVSLFYLVRKLNLPLIL